MNKEERNKYVGVLPSWIERFVPHLHFTPQGLLIKPRKNDRLVFDASHRVTAESACVNDFTSPDNEIQLEYGTALRRHLTRIYNLRITYPLEEILLFDDDASGAFRHVKYHPDIAGAYAFIINGILYLPLGTVFGSNVSSHNWEVFAISRARLAEWLQHQPHISDIVEKHKALLDLIQFPKDVFCSSTFIAATPDVINNGVTTASGRRATLNAMYVDDNLMADTWHYHRPALAVSVEALFIILGQPEERLRKSPLSMDKYYESLCS